ncbi:MAG: ABC transporter ATP-binding protein [Pseudodesulfovibrio sp.]|uniref:ABC transporter related protein n=1 Tax=Pseudodesulfovibrio aespoeensis (strain ATCC 700646 / DSM 10631 / Aspo-2) TaxID=643562 RepID=E6VXZ6_PSEA9|nr:MULTISPECIES: ABC transporter ATP-binding protein [Pseudodesulfovibrio]MBU4191003.1 ABC transporter ATP-binding protein [Pseudomonadota bacterium]ADU62703.1 ABC transporter related protein [Pseudodesulfovibrio aespoeensis Aspo-2]MBU4244724.1 ABC transporter ATP-binding protein [Pseudomonadota bacterium]MBU4377806.1 ABC transporter ATP-binding protein [Pseudomonadota bacterium]MBU4474322.1 ABC transporter ATP-binding protein [Pseudomonadota bacterium]
MLTIEDLHVNIGDKPVLQGINLEIRKGETFILFGPNGSGKTSLLMALMGFSGYEVTRGRILFKGQDITRAPMYERARLGIGMSFQRPPTIHGLRTRHLVQMCSRKGKVNPDLLADIVNMTDFLDRDINAGFSGGEIKRSELLQLMAQQPDLVLFDEPESGVDMENMQLVGKVARDVLDGNYALTPDLTLKARKEKARTAGLIITHTGYILDYVNADRGQVLYKGHLCCEGRPRDILDHIRQHGYQECVRCMN